MNVETLSKFTAENASELTAEVLFDQIGESYEDFYCNNDGLRKALNHLLQYHRAGESVLDIGCGPGGPASYLGKLGLDVTGIDISRNMINFCQKNIHGTFHKANMLNFNLMNQQFNAIVSLYSMFQISYRSTYSMLFKVASWLRPGGTFILAMIPAEELVGENITQVRTQGGYIERYESPFMGRMVPSTLITTEGWLDILQKAGLSIVNVERHHFQVKGLNEPEKHVFITTRKIALEPLFGPYPWPTTRRAPHLLSQSAWQPFAERLTRHEFDAVLEAVQSNKHVLDIGSEHGELPKAISRKLGKAYAIEPNSDRNRLLNHNAMESDIEIRQGTAEDLPYNDGQFDAVVALWILHYVDDLDKSLSEMVRVINPEAPNSRIIIVQGAPDNEVVNLINNVCAPIAGKTMKGSAVDHQGFLLATAARVFTNLGFGNITLTRVDAHCNFKEQELSERCEKASSILTGFWYLDHPQQAEMQEAFQPILREHFADREFEVGDQAVMMIAQPTLKD